MTPRLLRALRWFLNFAVAYHLVALVALAATGGYHVDLAGLELSSNRPDPLLLGLLLSAAARGALQLGWADAALVTFSTALALGAVELALQLINPPMAEPELRQIHQPSERYGFELVPGAEGVGNLGELIRINSYGARDAEFQDKGPHERRIVVLGDSFTFGFGLALEDGYVKQLQAMLGSGGVDVKVLNLGVSAYHLWQHVAQLQHRVAPLVPDLVVIGLFHDDLLAPERPPALRPRNPFAAHTKDRFIGSKTLNLVRNEFRLRHQRGREYLESIEARKAYLSADNADLPNYAVQVGNLSGAQRDGLARAVAAIAGWSRQQGVPVLGVFIPDASQLGEPDRQFPNRALESAFARAGLPFVDTTPRFEAVADPRPLFLFPLDAHTSREGHRLIAAAIAEHPAVAGLVSAR